MLGTVESISTLRVGSLGLARNRSLKFALTPAPVDDMFLETDIYSPAGNTFRIRPADLSAHIPWITAVSAEMPAGSKYYPEVGHNGNGNIEVCFVLPPCLAHF